MDFDDIYLDDEEVVSSKYSDLIRIAELEGEKERQKNEKKRLNKTQGQNEFEGKKDKKPFKKRNSDKYNNYFE